ncbi:hypothetical protein CONPUDRAFT_113118 [Coniophora puteana RWD-64-598 SS2]|uniref:Uncharacterized protein n=1 Tax=Coniophora puteana (strain RWD-64-598) TaxID=741705 RepID=R7SHN8_CONPW|nr:uncharacterized protein CONPUDRAFT_113118 [Coniophora puteana RWD-64-598 SS2]EIW74584.1 hypothetical protein CONPUDRAFT_113118 [Coniophora puteana RWD-64-598 SS2]
MSLYNDLKPITLYDIPSQRGAWSLNTVKTHFCLGYKGLPFNTEWVEYPDIAPKMQQLGADPVTTDPNRQVKYTLPVIYDPNQSRFVTDSFKIAEYLEETYPDPERPLFPHGSVVLAAGFENAFDSCIDGAHYWVLCDVPSMLNPRSAQYFLKTRSEWLKVDKLIDISSPGSEQRTKHENVMRKGLGLFEGWMKKSKGKWIMGDTFSFADIAIAAQFFWYMRVMPPTDWEKINGWRGDGLKWEQVVIDVANECNVKLDTTPPTPAS